ncbi:homeobox and leucine zipper encoding a [Entelurus aequoreus]|uniref:homeobox and leucine zipper encoding a n=1 Tax=Entelurus aequoreus TaxID=161455 RepID=UPI002B1D5839|nr:homeobox and leucine zipper encoding a [Entelurus aequoreus]
MATYEEQNGNAGIFGARKFLHAKKTKAAGEVKPEDKHALKDLHHSSNSSEGNSGSATSFTTNHNSVVCLPLVSEELKLVWTHSDQTSELDSIPELVQAFNLFPYPSSLEVNTLARVCSLPLDKVKVWFMVQRIKYGISWSSEEIEETRQKLSVPYSSDDSTKTEEAKVIVDKDSEVEEVPPTLTPQKNKPKCESPDSYKPTKSTSPCFVSTLPPPQDSYFYRPPSDTPSSAAAEVSLDLSVSSRQQHRHGRYKKSKPQLAALRKSFLRENWPAEVELRRLQEETGLSRNDIRKWFSDSRYQLRVGRGSLAAAQSFSNLTAGGGKQEQQSEPIPLTTQKGRQLNAAKGQEAARSNVGSSSHFFQTFLSNSLEAFGERDLEAEGYETVEDLSGDGDSLKDGEQSEEEPLQLTKPSKPDQGTPAQEPPEVVKSSASPSPSGTPPLTASPYKQPPNGISTSKKSAHSATGNNQPQSVASTSASRTTAGRPRKTKEQLALLKEHFLLCQWPKSEEYTELVKITGLPRADVIQWFGDTRYAVKNGQLRWVKGVRDKFLAELAAQQSSAALTNGSGTSSRVGGSRKRKSQANGTSADFPNVQPLVNYFLTTGPLNEKDLDTLCNKSKMSYQQVRDWFSAQVVETGQKPVVTD